MGKEVILRCRNIMKEFPGVKALDGVSLELEKGEVHALCGENGAGKSTLIKIITGIYQKDSGEMEYEGKAVNYKTAQECRKNGIALIPQEIHLAETLTVAENVFMTNYPKKAGFVDWDKMNKQTLKLQERLGKTAMSFAPDQLVKTLNMGQKQLVEIMKAISMEVKIIAFDEPTSSLSEEETQSMFQLIRQLTKEGITIIYVSHRLAEIFTICDRVSVYKDGKYMGTKKTNEVTSSEIVTMMVGRNINLYERTSRSAAEEIILKVEHMSWESKVKDVSFELKKGEILGVFGIVGAGRTEMANALFGITRPDKGGIYIEGKKAEIKCPKDAVKYKMGYVTEDRRGQGLALVMSVLENMTLPFFRRFLQYGILNLKKEKEEVLELNERLNVKTPSVYSKVGNLSGGNQQKIVIAKWLGANCQILIFDEPTRGIDVGAKSEIYKLMDELSKSGHSIMMISSDLPELLTMSDRILVFRDGEIVKEFKNAEGLTEEAVLKYAICIQ